MNLIINLNTVEKKLTYSEFVESIKNCVRESDIFDLDEIKNMEIEKYSHIILSGTPLMETKYLNNKNLFEFIKKCEKPMLGICAGYQAIAKAYGGEIFECKEIGMTEIETVVNNPLMEGNFKAYSLHNLAADKIQDCIALAESINCMQAFKHKTKNHYGVLFHPEVRNQKILMNFLKI